MYLMYVDESGDPGLHQYGSPHYILSGLIVHQNEWTKCLSRLKIFRNVLKEKYGLNKRMEIHATELIRINKLKAYSTITKSKRLEILKTYSEQIPVIFDTCKVINICLNKQEFSTTKDIQVLAWNRLIQRYDTFLKKSGNDKGIIIADDTDSLIINKLLRKMRIYNPVNSHFTQSSYNAPADNILEDLIQRNSDNSYFIQTVDVIAHCLYRKEFPKGSLRKFGIHNYFNKIEQVLLKEASKTDPLGIVRK